MADENVNQEAAGQPQEDAFGIDQKRMPFTQHLIELRWRVLVCVLVVALLAMVFFIGFSGRIFAWMTHPVEQAYYSTGGEARYHFKYEEMLQALTPMAMFMSATYFCLLAAIVVAAPLIIYQIWAFVAPGLKRGERQVMTRVVGCGSGLFLLGAAFAYFVALPVMLGFFLRYTASFGVVSRWNIADVIDFEMLIILIFGVSFEMPLVVVALTFLGILPPEVLAKRRRHAAAIIFIFAIVIAPTPDPFSQVCLAVPLILLYEVGLQVSKRIKRRGTLWDRWYGPVEQAPDESPEGDALYTPPADAAPGVATAPAYTEGSAYSHSAEPSGFGLPEGSQPAPAPADGGGAQLGLPAPAEPPATEPGPTGEAQGASPSQPSAPSEPAREPQEGAQAEGQRPTPQETAKPPDQEWDPNTEPMH